MVLTKWGKIKEYEKDNKVYLDIDQKKTPRTGPIFAAMRIIGIYPPRYIRFDKTYKGWHVIILLPFAIDRMQRIAIELACGSDARRGALNIRRARHLMMYPSEFWGKRSNILYSEKLK